MECIEVRTKDPYKVYVGRGILSSCIEALDLSPLSVALVSDSRVYSLYGEQVREAFQKKGHRVVAIPFPEGEASKNLSTLSDLLEGFAEAQLTRSDLVVALGGGVTGDLAGFASAVYLRGIPFVQIPTSLLAMVDASVGGKTAVDLKAGKNLAGSFHQPKAVFCDSAFLDSLSPERFREGAAESLKCGAIFEEALFEQMEAGGLFNEDRDGIIARCIRHKAEVVERDEFDRGDRQLLNFGHTPAHAIEKLSEFRIPHGEAVAMGMALMTRAAEKRGLCPTGSALRMEKALKTLGLPVQCPYTAKDMASIALSDKKRTGKSIKLVIPERIGHCVLHTLPVTEMEEFFQDGLETCE